MFVNIKNSNEYKPTRLQKTTEYKTKEQSTKYSSWSMGIQSYRMFGHIKR